MAREATGTVFESRGRWFGRVSLGDGSRKAVLLATCTSEEQATARANSIAALISRIRKAGKAAIVDLPKFIKEAGASPDDTLAEFFALVDDLCKGAYAAAGRTEGARDTQTTFRQLGERWTSGELAKEHPDYIRTKRTAKDDEYRLDKLYDAIGGTPIAAFTIDEAERAMRSLPAGLSPASRRQYAQLISKVLAMACYPLRLIKVSPLPRGWLPKVGPQKAKWYLYPGQSHLPRPPIRIEPRAGRRCPIRPVDAES